MKTFESVSAVRLRAVIAALLLAIGFVLHYAALLIHPVPTSNGLSGQVALAGSHPSEILLFCMLYLIGSIALLPGLVLLAGLVRGRGFWISFAAISVTLIGTLGNVGESAFKIAFVAIGADPDQSKLVAALSGLNGYIGPFLVLAAVFDLGVLLLCGAMWRARVARVWPLLVTLAGDVIAAIALGGKPGLDAGLLVGTLGLLWMCVGIARGPRADLAAGSSLTTLAADRAATV